MEQVPKNIEGHGKFLENFSTVLDTNICNFCRSKQFFDGGGGGARSGSDSTLR